MLCDYSEMGKMPRKFIVFLNLVLQQSRDLLQPNLRVIVSPICRLCFL